MDLSAIDQATLARLEPEILAEYKRFAAQLDHEQDLYGYGSGLSVRDVLRAHFLIANHFYLEGHGLGGIGPRSLDLLRSAVSRQFVSLGGTPKWSDRFDICATLFYGLIKNHPFHDANKRTAFLSILFFLMRTGWCPSIPEKEFENFTVEIADNQLGKYARLQRMEKDEEGDPEVRFISWYLRRNTRKIDRRDYVVTYRELQAILKRFNFVLSDPRHNHIDVVKVEVRRQLLGLLKPKTIEIKVAQIGFPRWSAQVGKGAIKTVREATGLTDRNGVDSAAFFQGLDPMQMLIATYHEPLMRLANR